MNFIKPNLKSLPEQVDINTNDIKNLKSVLKSSYKTEKELETTTITIPITDTNAPQDTTSGWLFDSVGHLFSINGGDDTNLLLEYYTNFRGPGGINGVAVVQTTGTSTESVMSQNAVTTELGGKANLDASNLSGENVASWRNKLNAGDTLISELELTSSHKNITITGLDLNSIPSRTIIIDYETKCSGRDFISCRPNNYNPTTSSDYKYQGGLMRLNSSNTSSGTGTLQGYAYVNASSIPVGETFENITVYKTITIHANEDGSIYSTSIEASCVSGAQSVGVIAGYLPSGAISNMTSIIIGLDVSSTQNLIYTKIKIYARR